MVRGAGNKANEAPEGFSAATDALDVMLGRFYILGSRGSSLLKDL